MLDIKSMHGDLLEYYEKVNTIFTLIDHTYQTLKDIADSLAENNHTKATRKTHEAISFIKEKIESIQQQEKKEAIQDGNTRNKPGDTL